MQRLSQIKKRIETEYLKMMYYINPKAVSNYLYRKNYNKKIDFKNPKTLNEKLMILKHSTYWKNQKISDLADKWLVRKYVEEQGFPEILTEIYAIYNNCDEIDWDSLPDKFALKLTHGCKMNIIVDDKSKFNKEEVFKKLRKWQREKFGYQTGEWHYLKIEPKIICEKYYGTPEGEYPIDYKVLCIKGKPVCTLVCMDRKNGTKRIFMDNNWKKMNICADNIAEEFVIKKPSGFEKMKEYAEKLSDGFPFVRVDFYEFEGKVLLSELTFTPAYCCMSSLNSEGQTMLGDML